MFTDNPITSKNQDAFGFASYVEVLESVVMETAPLPFCIGIFGPWGSGKTSFMQMLQNSLKTKNVRTIWFNPWKYDLKEDLWHALIQTVLSEISDSQIVDEEFKKKLGDLIRATGWLALKKVVAVSTANIISETNLDALADAFSKGDEKYRRHINHFEEDFAFVVKHYSNNGRLVIFIDDLDRCLPENAITVLESLKLFFNNEYCVFVVGIDHDVVEQGIQQRYAGKLALNGRDYLDKIIQIPFFLPHVPYEHLKASLPADQAVFTDEIWDIIHLAMEENPRKTRRFINSFALAQRFLNPPDQTLRKLMQDGGLGQLSEKEQNMYLAKILVFEMNFPEFYRHLQYNPGDWEYLVEKVIQSDTGEEREAALDKKGKLRPFWDNSAFKNFMNKTSRSSSGDYPPAPAEEIVSLLLQTTNLVAKARKLP